MTTLTKSITMGTSPLESAKSALDYLRTIAQHRLTEVYNTAKDILFDDSSRFVFLSDCHRGDNSRADGFAGNEDLFVHALSHYHDSGFTYVEVGDGDDLWKNRRFSDIRRAHERTFNLLHRFNQKNRLHLILGNHETLGSRHDWTERDGMAVHEGLILRHATTGQRIFTVHGHQADFMSDRFRTVNGFVVRNIWRRFQLIDFWGGTTSRGGNSHRDKGIRGRITDWLHGREEVVICGHTHRLTFATKGESPYFNTGSCLVPGLITGLEIQDGEIRSVKWSSRPGRNGNRHPHFQREPMAPPRKLHSLN